MATSRKLWMTATLGLLWLGGALLALQGIRPTSSELYEEWLRSRRSPTPPGVIERWSSRMGIRWVAELRRRSDFRLTETLLAHEDYALAVASWRDSSPGFAPGVLETWPHVRRALSQQIGKGEWQRLQDVFSRTDAAGFSEAGLALARSADRSRAMRELDVIIEELREFEREKGEDASLSGSLGEISRIYSLSIAELGRALAAETDAAAGTKVEFVMQARGVAPQQAFLSLWREWKTGGLPEADMDLAGRLARDLRWGNSRTEYLAWLMLKPESEVWRKGRRDEIGGILEVARKSDPSYARDLASHLVREMMKESAELGQDWSLTAGWLLAKIDPEPDLSVWIHDSAGPDFAWLCRQVNAEGLLNRAVVKWAGQIRNPHGWIGEFIDSEHFAAACALVEGSGEVIVSIRSRAETYQEETSKGLGDYLELAGEIARHTSHSQVKGYIQLLVGRRALANLRRMSGDEGARRMVFEAIARLNEAEIVHPGMLRQTVGQLVEMDREFFEAGRPCFDRWRGGRTLDEVAEAIHEGLWEPENTEKKIWEKYSREFATIDEVPGIIGIIEEILAAGPLEESGRKSLDRLLEFLGSRWSWVREGSAELGLVTWGTKRMASGDRTEEAAEWMFEQVRNYLKRHPGEDEFRVLGRLYEDVSKSVASAPADLSMKWLGRVLDEKVSGDLAWPDPLSLSCNFTERLTPELAPETFQKAFGDHPLRVWIFRELLHVVSLGKTLEEQRKTLFRMGEGENIEGWMRDAIKDQLEYRVDFDQFEKDMAFAPAGARRYFLGWAIDEVDSAERRKRSQPWNLTEEESTRLNLWMGEQAVDAIARKQAFPERDLDLVFERLLRFAGDPALQPRVKMVLKRLQQVPLRDLPRGASPVDTEAIKSWQARTSFMLGEGASEEEILIGNEALPVTERVWGLVLKGRMEEARGLMFEQGDELTFLLPPRVSEADFASGNVAAFPGTLPEGSGLRLYAEMYLDFKLRAAVSRAVRMPQGISWSATARIMAQFEDGFAGFTRKFESASFEEKELERRVFHQLRAIWGLADLMPRKVEALKTATKGDNEIDDRIALAGLELRLAREQGRDDDQLLPELQKAGASSSILSDGVEVMKYHFWRKALLNKRFHPDERKLLEVLAFETNPLKVLLPSGNVPYRQGPMETASAVKMQVVDYALRFVELKPESGSEWSWSAFPMARDTRYDLDFEDSADFFQRLAAVLAERCRAWDEESRWHLMELLQTDAPGFSRTTPNRTITIFASNGFFGPDEAERRFRDFADKYPHDGWTYQTAISFGQETGDDTLVDFGWLRVEPYVAGNPGLARVLDRFRK